MIAAILYPAALAIFLAGSLIGSDVATLIGGAGLIPAIPICLRAAA